jgi:hypothetical protein
MSRVELLIGMRLCVIYSSDGVITAIVEPSVTRIELFPSAAW